MVRMSPAQTTPRPPGASRPVNDRAARKVPAAADQCDAIPKLVRVALPQLDRRPLPHDPFLIGGIEMDRAAEGFRPFVHRRVEMRMRDRDRFQAPESLDETDRRRIECRNAVPENIAPFRSHQDRALPDGKTGADADDAGIVFVERVHVALLQRGQRRPGLAARRHVLPLLLADRALGGRLRAFRILRAAGGADVEGHGFPYGRLQASSAYFRYSPRFCKALYGCARPRDT